MTTHRVNSLLRFATGIAVTASLAACGGLTSGALPNAATATVRQSASPNMRHFKFKTIDNTSDPTFNQLLGINNMRTISGYYGGGTAGHPNKGYTVVPPYKQANFTAENYPGSMQTQVTCIDNLGNTGGFWVDNSNVNRGFIEWNGVFTSYTDPQSSNSTVNQILGLNDNGIAAGFYTDGSGVNHGFTLDQATGKFKPVEPPGATNVTASAINNSGDVVGFYTSSSQVVSFLERGGKFSAFSYPGSTSTMAFGVNDHDAIVGGYADASGNAHGFLLQHPLTKATFTSIDDPHGIGTTTLNGLNDRLNMVGFYVDPAGNTDGMLIENVHP
jgi:hypothetical protein